MIIPLKNRYFIVSQKNRIGFTTSFFRKNPWKFQSPPCSPRLKVRKPSTIAWSAAHRRPFSGPRRNDSTIETNHTSVCHGQDGMHGESEKVTWKNIWDWNATSNNRMYHGCWIYIYIYSWMISRSSVKIIVRTMFISSETDRSPSWVGKVWNFGKDMWQHEERKEVQPGKNAGKSWVLPIYPKKCVGFCWFAVWAAAEIRIWHDVHN